MTLVTIAPKLEYRVLHSVSDPALSAEEEKIPGIVLAVNGGSGQVRAGN